MTCLFNIAWESVTVPKEWQTGLVVPLFKRTRWRDYISTLAWERWSKLVNVAWEREVWGPLIELFPHYPTLNKRKMMR